MSSPLSARYRREFLGVALLVSVLTTLITYFIPIHSINRFLYDVSVRHSHYRPASKDIIIITIDDQSLEQLGTWPWRRILHVQLLRQLTQAKAVGYDISFLGASYHPDDDKEFAQAIKEHGRVVLASFFNEGQPPSLPDAPLLKETNQIGFINIPIASDGLVRKLDRWASDGFDTNYHFSLAMLLAAGIPPEKLDKAHLPSRVSIPYAGPPNHYQTVSYTDVLNLRVPEDMFKDKYVLIGAWATGLGDKFPTPTSTESINMSGVEILANGLQAEIEDRWITEADTTTILLVSLFWVLSYCVLVLMLSPRNIIFASLALVTILLASHFAILKYFNLWIRLDPSLIVILLVYPLWNWRMQELVLKQMHREITELDNERSLLSMEHVHITSHTPSTGGLNTFDAHISRLRSAIARVRNLRQFITDSLDGMPYASAVFDHQERLLLTTAITEKYFTELGATIVPQEALPAFIHQIIDNEERTAEVLAQIRHWSSQNMVEPSTFAREELEFKDKQNRDILLKFTNTYMSDGSVSGFILTLIDLSRIREEERQREQTIHFLTHDMRAPQSAIQALIKMQQNPETELSREDFLQQVNQLSRTTLNLVDNFLYLARAKNTSYQLVPINLNDLLQNVIDNFWSMAKSRQMSIQLSHDIPICYVMADGALLSRAFNNLIDNAIKYGKDGMKITIDIAQDKDYWKISITDQGIGIAKEDFSRIFQVFSRVPQMEVVKRISGLGLGLAFVHTVINGHNGDITLESEEGVGTTFFVRLPILHDEESV